MQQQGQHQQPTLSWFVTHLILHLITERDVFFDQVLLTIFCNRDQQSLSMLTPVLLSLLLIFLEDYMEKILGNFFYDLLTMAA